MDLLLGFETRSFCQARSVQSFLILIRNLGCKINHARSFLNSVIRREHREFLMGFVFGSRSYAQVTTFLERRKNARVLAQILCLQRRFYLTISSTSSISLRLRLPPSLDDARSGHSSLAPLISKNLIFLILCGRPLYCQLVKELTCNSEN